VALPFDPPLRAPLVLTWRAPPARALQRLLRRLPRGRAPDTEEVDVEQDVTFGRDIRPLFRDQDIASMSYTFDLASYEDVRAHADDIYARLEAGDMPCDRAWPAADVQRFHAWMDGGYPA